MNKTKLMAWAIVLAVCSVALVGIGHSAYTGTYANENNTATVSQTSHTVGIWSGTSGNYTLVSNGGLVNNITYEVSSHTTGSGTTYSAESQQYTLIENKFVFIDGSQGMSTYTPGNVLLKISGFNPDYISGDSITVKLGNTAMAGETVTVGNDMSWYGILTLGNTENTCKLTVSMETQDEESYTYNGFANLSISVRMLYSSERAFYNLSMTEASAISLDAGTTEKVIGVAYLPSAASSKVTLTFGTALPAGSTVHIGGVLCTSSDQTVFDCSTSLNGGVVKITLPQATGSPLENTVTLSYT